MAHLLERVAPLQSAIGIPSSEFMSLYLVSLTHSDGIAAEQHIMLFGGAYRDPHFDDDDAIQSRDSTFGP
jgi:hypothetical protein